MGGMHLGMGAHAGITLGQVVYQEVEERDGLEIIRGGELGGSHFLSNGIVYRHNGRII